MRSCRCTLSRFPKFRNEETPDGEDPGHQQTAFANGQRKRSGDRHRHVRSFCRSERGCASEEFPDLLHLNKLGYDKWAAALRPVLATLDFMETQDDAFQIEPGFTSLFNGKDLTGWGFLPNASPNRKPNPNPDAPWCQWWRHRSDWMAWSLRRMVDTSPSMAG